MSPPTRALDERTVRPGDPDYPQRLLGLPRFRPPAVLFVRGHGRWPPARAVAVIGSRAATPYALRVAAQVAASLARQDVCVVSGLARGVDAAAHEAALARAGPTLAVLGTGVDQVYPPAHGALYTALRERGALVSAFPPGTPPRHGHFPARNRLLAALVDGVVLVQAEARSGAHHTVRAALAFGRWVLIAPWPLGEPAFQGNADWLARAVEGTGVLTDAALPVRRALAAPSVGACAPTGDRVDSIAATLDSRPRSLDELARRSGLAVGGVAAALIELELLGRAERLPGNRYRRRDG